MWGQLPELILTQVFGYLDRPNRVNVDQVCQHWSRCLGSPSLWRRCVLNIDRDLTTDSFKASELAIKYGEHMRILKLAWSRPYELLRVPRTIRDIQAEAGADFLINVRNRDVQLREFTFTNWVSISKWQTYNKFLCALANFLACQQNLEIFNLMNANLGVSVALRLLSIVGRVSGTRLASLDLRGAFREWQAPHNNARYLKSLSRLDALTHLSLDYPALSNKVLNALSTGTSKVLQTLHVSIRYSDYRDHRIEDSAWHNLVNACPRLTVSYTIINISHYEDMCYLLLPSVPLAKFQMYGDYVWDQSRTRNFRGTVRLLISNYTDTLAEVMIESRHNREMLDDLIVSMLVRCKRLRILQFDGVMRNLDTMRDICQLQADCKTHFQTIHLKPRIANSHNRAILHSINYEYNQKLTDQHIDFRIDNPA